MKRPFAYITAAWSDNEYQNTEEAAKYCRAVYDAGFTPICPLLFLPLFSMTTSRRSTRTASTWAGTSSGAATSSWSAATAPMRR